MEQALEISEIKKKNQEERRLNACCCPKLEILAGVGATTSRGVQTEEGSGHVGVPRLKESVDSLPKRRGLDMMEKDRDRIAMEQREAAVSISNLRSEAGL